MKQLLIRADDLGYSYAIDLGIARTVSEGVVRSVGLMPNMPEASRGWSLVARADIAVGQHTNLCLGKPCADPALIPSLLGPDGCFRRSREYHTAWAAGVEPIDFDEACIEIRAQRELFVQIVGREPDYFEAHAVRSNNLYRAIHEVAGELGLKEQPLPLDVPTVRCGATEVRLVMESMRADYVPARDIRRAIEDMADGQTVVLICHPGYLDEFALATSSLARARAQEADLLVDPAFSAWLNTIDDLRLIDYRDL